MIWKSIKLFVETNVKAIYLFQPFSHLTKPVDAYFHPNWIPWFSKSQICSLVSKPTNSAEPRASHPSPLDQGKEELDLYRKIFHKFWFQCFHLGVELVSVFYGCLHSRWLNLSFCIICICLSTHICIGHFAAISPDNSSKDFTWCCEWGGRRPRMIVSSEELTPCWRQLSNTWNYDPGSQCTSGDGLLTVWYQINYLVLGSITKCISILNPLRNGLNIT